jgi:hypothetical protein
MDTEFVFDPAWLKCRAPNAVPGTGWLGALDPMYRVTGDFASENRCQ